MIPLLLLFALTLAVTLYGRGKYQSAYDEELANHVSSGMTGAELAARILKEGKVTDVEVVESVGLFADFYDPAKKRLSLATNHFKGSTYTALGIAAHEAGHALQDREGFAPLQWRISAIRATTTLTLPLVFLGIVMTILPGFAKSGIWVLLIGWIVLTGYNLATLPVERDATERAKKVLGELRPFRNIDERLGVERVMKAACAYYIEGIFRPLSWLRAVLIPKLKDL